MKHTPKINCASYLTTMMDPATRDAKVRQTIEFLQRHEFDALAVRGLSGLIIAPIVADRMNKTLLIVRKPKDTNHSYRKVEGDYGAKRYIILDDLVSSGDTVRAIEAAIRKDVPTALCLGVYQYLYPKDGVLRSVPFWDSPEW
jgi:adenine/guanine phosphoribosyltransferase-like PRPP-binding protein